MSESDHKPPTPNMANDSHSMQWMGKSLNTSMFGRALNEPMNREPAPPAPTPAPAQTTQQSNQNKQG